MPSSRTKLAILAAVLLLFVIPACSLFSGTKATDEPRTSQQDSSDPEPVIEEKEDQPVAAAEPSRTPRPTFTPTKRPTPTAMPSPTPTEVPIPEWVITLPQEATITDLDYHEGWSSYQWQGAAFMANNRSGSELLMRFQEGWVVTDTGDMYPASVSNYSPWDQDFYSISKAPEAVIDNPIYVPFGYYFNDYVIANSTTSWNRYDFFAITTEIPSAQKPVSIHIPDYDPIEVNNLGDYASIVEANIEVYNQFPRIDEKTIQVGPQVMMDFRNPRIIQYYDDTMDADIPVVMFDVTFRNQDTSSDQGYLLLISTLSTNASVYSGYSTYCEDYGAQTDGLYADIGPGLEKEATLCIPLPHDVWKYYGNGYPGVIVQMSTGYEYLEFAVPFKD